MGSTSFQVEKLGALDRRALNRFLLDITSVPQDGGGRVYRRGSADRLMRSATGPNSSVLVVKGADGIIGYAETHDLGGRGIHFHRAAVHHDFRKMGVFTALLDAVIQLAAGRSIEADIREDRGHYQTMLQRGFTPKGPSTREAGMVKIVR